MAHEGEKIKGELWFLKLRAVGGPTYLTLICQKDTTLAQSTDVTDANSKCGEDTAPGKTTRNIDGSFFIIEGTNVGAAEVSIATLQGWFDASTTLEFQLGASSPVTGDCVYTGKLWLNKLDVKAPVDGYIEMDYSASVSSSTMTVTV